MGPRDEKIKIYRKLFMLGNVLKTRRFDKLSCYECDGDITVIVTTKRSSEGKQPVDELETYHLTFPPCFVTGNDCVAILIFAQDVC